MTKEITAAKRRPKRGLFELSNVIQHRHADFVRLAGLSLECAREIGVALLEAKKQLPHGKWLPWLKRAAPFSERVAQNYMRIARGWEEIQAKANGDSDLTYSGALALLAPQTVTVQADALPGEADGKAVTVRVIDRADFSRPADPPVSPMATGVAPRSQAARDGVDPAAGRAERRLAQMRSRAEAAPEQDRERWRVVTGDCIEELARLPDRPRLIFADPPYNQGVDYGGGPQEDRLPDPEHRRWMALWVKAAAAALADDGTLAILSRHEIHPWYVAAAEKAGLAMRNVITWVEGFGQNTERKFARVSRPILIATKDPRRFVFNAAEVLKPSDRQTKYNDRRAVACGKVMGDVWDDVKRLAGTHKERIPSFPTQLPVALVSRLIAVYADEGDLVCDPFSGSATTGEAALTLGCRYVGIERSGEFAELSRLRLRGVNA